MKILRVCVEREMYIVSCEAARSCVYKFVNLNRPIVFLLHDTVDANTAHCLRHTISLVSHIYRNDHAVTERVLCFGNDNDGFLGIYFL